MFLCLTVFLCFTMFYVFIIYYISYYISICRIKGIQKGAARRLHPFLKHKPYVYFIYLQITRGGRCNRYCPINDCLLHIFSKQKSKSILLAQTFLLLSMQSYFITLRFHSANATQLQHQAAQINSAAPTS